MISSVCCQPYPLQYMRGWLPACVKQQCGWQRRCLIKVQGNQARFQQSGSIQRPGKLWWSPESLLRVTPVRASFPEVPGLFGDCEEQQNADADILFHEEVRAEFWVVILRERGKGSREAQFLSFANNYQTTTWFLSSALGSGRENCTFRQSCIRKCTQECPSWTTGAAG